MQLDTVVCGDCLDVMGGMGDGCVDAIITDPPYGLDFRGNGWDTFIPKWIEQARRVAAIVAFTTAPTTQWDYPRPDWVNCWYREASNSRTPAGGFNHWTPILIYGKVKFPVDSIKLHAIQHAYPKGFAHPSPKPKKLLCWLIENCTNLGDLVFDPFMGSGTTAVAAIKTGRHFYGCDINPAYVEIANQRIAKARAEMAQLSMELA